MKAVVLEEKNAPFIIKEVDKPNINDDEVLIKIKSAAFNHRDIWIQKGMYAGLKYPCILGSDGAGIVEEIGKNVNKNLLNKEVIINPSLDWGNNEKFQNKDFKVLGLPDDGTFAEYIKISSTKVFEKPEYLNFEQAASLPLAGLTAYRAIFSRANLEKNDKVLITGIGGGVALFAFQFALALGCEVYVTSGSDEKIQKALSLGAKSGVNYNTENWDKQLNMTFDVIVDSAGGDGFSKLIDLASYGARIVFFGGTKGVIKKINTQKVFWKQLSILGSTMGSDKEFLDMMNFINQYKIQPVIDKVFNYKDVKEASERMANSNQFGKIVLNFSF
ncbi:MAG: zinc-binding dehydrogenase [Candidatus Sericytochromatia bacterium]